MFVFSYYKYGVKKLQNSRGPSSNGLSGSGPSGIGPNGDKPYFYRFGHISFCNFPNHFNVFKFKNFKVSITSETVTVWDPVFY